MNNNYLQSENIIEKNIKINNIPSILMTPKWVKGKLPSLIFYHGWSSSKESQRMRGFILASIGFQVLMPDAINHGERNALDIYNLENAEEYFWPTISKNIEESDFLIEGLINDYNADEKSMGVIGHSMGGFSTAGVFTKNKDLGAAVILNGSCDWEESNNYFTKNLFKEETEHMREVVRSLDRFDPSKNMEDIKDRPLLLLHGKKDSLVEIEAQDDFYKMAEGYYSDKNKLKYIKYDNLNHFVTTNMMEESIIWFKEHL